MPVAPVVATYTDHDIWSDIKEIDSSDTNVKKFVFTTADAVAESVLYKYPTYNDRTVICCSTQSGCPVGCRFCGAGDRFIRSLTADEIISQPVHLLESQGIDASEVDRMQIMFMSMGEPLLNSKHLYPAIRELYGLYPRAALLISTSGPKIDYAALRELSVEVPTVGLQFSVHESTDEARDKLIPFKAKLPLSQMGNQGEQWFEATGRQPFFNYCVHERNNTDRDVHRLASVFDSRIWQATISVICERDESIAAANDRQRSLASDFMSKMAAAGYSTRMFDPAGQDDIGGGCGQLWYVQDWMDKHPALARPSIGLGLPIVHTPVAT
jgi:23S rRNA (adenine2503-C2)-methyltransferase